jgi:RNA polymerase sigma factor (sigma-70 family)
MALGSSSGFPLCRLRARGGLTDFDLFSAFYDANAERLLVFFARRCADGEVAADLTAETFAKAYAGRDGYRGRSDAEAEAWLFGIARNLLADYLRRGVAEREAIERLGIEVPALSQEEHARIEELAGIDAIRAVVAEHFDRLSEEQREAVRLRIVEEVAYAEIASRLGISEEAVRARVSRGLKQLAVHLDQIELLEGAPK